MRPGLSQFRDRKSWRCELENFDLMQVLALEREEPYVAIPSSVCQGVIAPA
jgi:hypothetical protein